MMIRKLAVPVLVCAVCLAVSAPAFGTVDPIAYELPNRFAAAMFNAASNPGDPVKLNSLRAIPFTMPFGIRDANHAESETAESSDGLLSGPLFRNFTPFGEYSWSRTRARKHDGLKCNVHSGTAGFTFTTFADCQAGAIFSVTHTHGHSTNPSRVRFDSDGFAATFFLDKTMGWLYFGSSVTYGYTGAIANTLGPDSRRYRTKMNVNTFVVCPYVGAQYVSGPLSVSVTPTYMFRHQDSTYGSGINASSSEGTSDGTFILANTVSYACTDQVVASFNFDYNQIVHEDRSRYVNDTDSAWLTLGPKVTYRLKENCQVYASYTASLLNQDFENHQIDVGLAVRF